MSYNFFKLGEVEKINSPESPNILIEENGRIKRVSPENIIPEIPRPDWNESDETSPAYIKNKPNNVGGSNIITYVLSYDNTVSENSLYKDGQFVNCQDFFNDYNNNVIKIINGSNISDVLSISYTMSGSNYINIHAKYYDIQSASIKGVNIYG